MSADHWGICPKCNRDAIKAKEALALKIQQAYGNLPEEEYLALVMGEAEPIKLEYTLREDCWIGIDTDGVFEVRYSCHCTECGFSHKFMKIEEAYDGN